MGFIRAAIDHYKMIDEGDKIAVGVSGGKDSLVLLNALAGLKNYYPKNFDIEALIIDPQFKGVCTNFEPIESMCNKLGVKLHIRRSDLAKIVFDERKEKNPCSLCARMRRGMLHNMAIEIGCNKVALGHHYDDAVQTFFMNLFNSGKIGCFSPKTYLDKKNLWLIRPIIFCQEKLIASSARRYELPIVKVNVRLIRLPAELKQKNL